jgi:hypothetical protein
MTAGTIVRMMNVALPSGGPHWPSLADAVLTVVREFVGAARVPAEVGAGAIAVLSAARGMGARDARAGIGGDKWSSSGRFRGDSRRAASRTMMCSTEGARALKSRRVARCSKAVTSAAQPRPPRKAHAEDSAGDGVAPWWDWRATPLERSVETAAEYVALVGGRLEGRLK